MDKGRIASEAKILGCREVGKVERIGWKKCGSSREQEKWRLFKGYVDDKLSIVRRNVTYCTLFKF